MMGRILKQRKWHKRPYIIQMTATTRNRSKEERASFFLQNLFYKSRPVHNSFQGHSRITEAYFVLLLAISSLLNAILVASFDSVPWSCKLGMGFSALVVLACATLLMRKPSANWPGPLAIFASLLSMTETAFHISGQITYSASVLFPIFLTILMAHSRLKLYLGLIISGIALIVISLCATGYWGVPSALSSLEYTYLSFLIFSVNLVHVGAITLTFKASQKNQTNLLARQKEKLISINQERRNFLAMASHELRTPMNAIIGSIEILDSSADAQSKAGMMDLIRDAAKELSNQLDDLLDMSNMENNQLKLSPTPTNILELAQRSISLWKGHANDKELYINLNHDNLCNTQLLIDPARTQQILNNLLSNAIRSTQKGGITIDLRCSSPSAGDKALVRILVSDSSEGIAQDLRQNLFAPDSKIPSIEFTSLKRFGLHVSRLIAKKMSGDIELLERPAPGAHFLFTFEAPFAELSESNCANITFSGKRRILCVDDHPANLRILNVLLSEQGFNVDVAMNGEQAIKLCGSHRTYDAILVDIMMPGISGVETAKAIRQLNSKNADIPIIAVTANVAPEQIDQYYKSGMCGVVSKPIETRSLMTELTTVLIRYQNRQKNKQPPQASSAEAQN